MRKLKVLIGLLCVLSGLAACSSGSSGYGNSPEVQRQHAKDAQDELSRDTGGGSK